jgi:hypothetical protein
VSASPQAIPLNKRRRIAKFRRARPIPPLCGDGRLVTVCCWLKAGAIVACFFQSPTIVAWDLGALSRILPIEARSP